MLHAALMLVAYGHMTEAWNGSYFVLLCLLLVFRHYWVKCLATAGEPSFDNNTGRPL